LPALPRSISLKAGDFFLLTSSPEAGFEGKRGGTGTFENEPRIACTAPEIFPHIKAKETVLFDDGKIEGHVVEKNEDGLRIEVTRTDAGGGKLRADKGVNFPDSDIKINGLTAKDRTDLEFVARYAEIVNVSFVNRETDVEELFALLDKHRVLGKIGVILKIETRQGFNNLIRILLTAMQTHPVGVMIARGDLAVESGWNRIAWIQEEILSICQAAHIPDIWATQVLEALAKTGMPTRAEITDAAMGQRAECVMLNKGPKIVDAVRLLDGILKDAHLRQIKNTHLLPVLERVRDTTTLGSDGEQTIVVHRDDGK
jgi:pyruvate kinase